MTPTWELPPDILHLHRGEVHTWRVWLDLPSHNIEIMQSAISKPEMVRAEKFHFQKDRARFIAAHNYLRQILAKYLDLKPDEVRYIYNEHGKPELNANLSPLRFNLSHSGSVGLIAVTKISRIGVDVEQIKYKDGIEKIAERFFTQGEVEQLLSQPESQRVEAFFRCWTRKEAYIKALGVGMLISPDQFEVSFELDVPAKITHIDSDEVEAAHWNLYHLNPMEGYVGALVVEGEPADLKYLQMVEWAGS